MDLPANLVKEFVKSTLDSTDDKKPSRFYGTADVRDDGIYVTLDGSSSVTPVSMVTDAMTGDRVLVEIVDHKARIIQNLDKSNSDIVADRIENDETGVFQELRVGKEYVETLIANDITADSIVADRAKIGELEADNATINGKLTAQEASIESLEADNATINGKLTAQEASIGSLEADNATINGKLTAQEAEISNLSGEFASFVSGEFGTLSADVADIQTLMFGSATGTTITSEFANTVVSHIGEAQIDSAMIKDLTFDKITGFDVNTTNLTIHSEDGKSQWHDNTIQISDANRVRVQIGKDASSDYSMYVWDAAGNLMFDALGLTDSGIQREIIRNDMVAEDAAINGSKLDIESVFREMDGSTYTLTSNHLTYDGKSLDLTLESMSETDKEQGQLLSSQGTQITAIQGQIASKIWQQDIDTATGEMNTKYSELEQELNGFKTTVGETYSTKAEAEVLAEAANNAQKTAEDAQLDLNNAKANLANVTSRVDATEEDIAAAQKAVDDAQTAADNAKKAADNAKKAADQAQSDVNALTKRVETAETSISQNTEQISLRATKSEVTTAKDEALNESKSYTDAQIKVSADGITSSVSKTYATKEALSAAETRITQTEKSINSQVSETNGLKDRMSTVEQTANGLEVRLSTAESDIDTAQSTADNAAKTATNFMGYDGTNGLLIGNKTSGSWSGYRSQMLPTAFNILDENGNPMSSYGTVTTIGKTSGQHVYIDSDSLDIKNGTTVLATFSGDTLKCGENFSVDKTGKIKSTSGTIGGFTISSGALLSNNKIGLYKNGSISVVGASSYTTTDGSTLYSTLECNGGTLFLDSNSSGTLDGSSASEGKFIIDFGFISGFGKGETSSWLNINNLSKHFSISKGGRLYVRGTDGNEILGVLSDAGMIQVASLHCYKDIIFPNASLVGTDDAPSGRHTLANNTSVSFLNSSGTRVRGMGFSSSDNLLLGADTATAGMYGYITAQNNIVFYAGTTHDQCFASIYDSGKRYFQSKPIYDRTTSSGTAVRVNSNGTLYRYSSSSMRYKEEITCQLSEELNPERLYDLNVWQYKYREGHLDKGDQRYGMTHIGLLAEDVKHHYPIAANYNEDGDVEDWSERYLIPPMLKLIQMQHEEIEAIKAELEEMRAS